MSAPGGPTSAELVAGLEARTPRPLFFLVALDAGATAAGPPSFLPRGLVVRLDGALAIVGREAFGALPLSAADAATGLSGLTGSADDRVLVLRNRFLLPRLAEAAPALLAACRAVLVQAPDAANGRLPAAALAAVLHPFGFGPATTGRPAPNGTVHLLFERATEAPVPVPTTGGPAVLESRVAFEDGFVTGELRLDRAAGPSWQVALFADRMPVGIGAATPAGGPDRLAFRIWAAPELLSSATPVLSVALTRFAERVPVRDLARPAARRFVPDALLDARDPADALRQPFGLLLLADGADPDLSGRLRTLAGRGMAGITHLRLDGLAGPAHGRVETDATALGFAGTVVHRGPVGRDKSAVQGLWHMARAFRRVAVVEDAAPDDRLMAAIAAGPSGPAAPGGPAAWRAGNGWLAAGDRLAPLVRDLAFLFSLEEADYRTWTREAGGEPADAFAWEDALARLLDRDHREDGRPPA